MSLRKFVFLILFLLPALGLLSQNSSSIDSLEKVLAHPSDPDQEFYALLNLSSQLINSDVSKALSYGEKAYDLAKNQGKDRLKLTASLLLARIYFFRSDLNKAMEYAIGAKTLAIDLNLKEELAYSLDAIGAIYYDIGYQAKSSENFFTSLKIYEELNDKNGIGATYCRIGTLYLDQKDYDKALDYYSRSIQIAQEIKSDEGIASNLNNVAKVNSQMKQYDKALKSYEEALQINIRMDDLYLAASNYLNIAEVYLHLKQYEVAVSNVQQAMTIFNKLGNKLRLAKSQVMLSEIYFETGQPDKCESIALNTLNIGKEHGFKEIIVSSSGMLNRLYLSQNDSLDAFRYYILEKQYKDSLFLEEKQKTLAKLELQYQFEKNEQDLRLAKQRKNVVILIISGGLFFSIIIILLILKQLKLKAKKMQLEKAGFEREMDFKNKEMVLNVMSLMKKNEMLAGLSEKLITIEKEATSEEGKNTIQKVAHELKRSQEEEIWKEFSHRFKEVHGEFYNNLLEKFPSLSPNELKLCAFLRLNMSSKDIAELTGQRISTLETARYRLRQKLGIVNSDVNLITFLSSI